VSAPTPPEGARVLAASFFERDTVTVARELLGKLVVSTAGGEVTGGLVVEAEAYLGADDAGSHAATKGVTKRNAVMYGPPGHSYVYFTYGNHHMLNLVTEPRGTAGAVLVRALEPTIGLETMRLRRAAGRRGPGRPLSDRDLANGPGKLAAALGLDLTHNGRPLDGSAALAVYDVGATVGAVASSGRIGLSSGHELELRFFLEGSPYVSAGRIGAAPPRARERKARNEAQ
jgi:DNA-3-methyladenine glycosylase